MADTQRLTIQLDTVAGAPDRWSVPVSTWPGFRILDVRTEPGDHPVPFILDAGQIVYRLPDGESRPFASIEVESPTANIEASKLALEREKAKTEDIWRSRTYMFSIGSAVLTAAVTLAVAWIARPSHDAASFNVDAVQSCRDSLQRLSSLTQYRDQTVGNLSTAIKGHVDTCDGVLDSLISAAAKKDSK
jgi:hypothetical protein